MRMKNTVQQLTKQYLVILKTTMLLGLVYSILMSPMVVLANDDAPVLVGPWTSLRPGVEYQLSQLLSMDDDFDGLPSSINNSQKWREMQERVLRSDNNNFHSQFLENSATTYYDEYSQAWRMLGFYIDCNANTDVRARVASGASYRRSHRQLNQGNAKYATCQRYLLWAAYVDVNYEGGGIGEYQLFDTNTGKWDDTACRTINPTYDSTDEDDIRSRCVPMDCHLSTSKNFKLLGFYREADFGDFFEQLFKHQGYCVWQNDDLTSLMYTYSMWWPEACTQTQMTVDGSALYYDVKPSFGGRFSIGLYTNAICTTEYNGTDVTVDSILNNDSSLGMTVEKFTKHFNDALDVFRVCQPCKASTVVLAGRSSGDEGSQRRLDDPNEGNFQCTDKAGYTNVNQCMKFATKTNLQVASFRDVQIASQQGMILAANAPGVAQSNFSLARQKYGFLIFSILFFVINLLCFGCANARARRRQSRVSGLTEPFVRHN
jgi:hypothetical protein